MPDAMILRMISRLILALFLVVSAPAFAAEQKPRTSPVAAGEIAPDFTLSDQNGRQHTLFAERGKRPVVLVFYRGHW